MYFKRDKQSMAAKRPVRQRRGGSKVSPKKKRQLFLPESSGRTSCLVMSAVPPELPGVPRSLARSFFTISAAPVTRGLRRAYWRQGFPTRRGSVCSSRVFVHALARTRLSAAAALSVASGMRYFSRSLLFSNSKNSTAAPVCQSAFCGKTVEFCRKG